MPPPVVRVRNKTTIIQQTSYYEKGGKSIKRYDLGDHIQRAQLLNEYQKLDESVILTEFHILYKIPVEEIPEIVAENSQHDGRYK